MQEILYKNFGDDQAELQDIARAERRFHDLLCSTCDISKVELSRNLIRDASRFGASSDIDIAVQWQDNQIVVDLFLPCRAYTAPETELLHLMLFHADSFSLVIEDAYGCDIAMQLLCALD